MEKHNCHDADLANYARRSAKQQRGKNALVLYDEHMRQNALLQRELNGQLELALEQGELEAWFQPKVDMPSGKIIGSEALVRWRHPTRGLLMPGSFMPLFERNGSVVEIDLYMFEQACKALRDWQARGLPVLPVSCNFSSLHFDKPDLPGRLAAIAAPVQCAARLPGSGNHRELDHSQSRFGLQAAHATQGSRLYDRH